MSPADRCQQGHGGGLRCVPRRPCSDSSRGASARRCQRLRMSRLPFAASARRRSTRRRVCRETEHLPPAPSPAYSVSAGCAIASTATPLALRASASFGVCGRGAVRRPAAPVGRHEMQAWGVRRRSGGRTRRPDLPARGEASQSGAFDMRRLHGCLSLCPVGRRTRRADGTRAAILGLRLHRAVERRIRGIERDEVAFRLAHVASASPKLGDAPRTGGDRRRLERRTRRRPERPRPEGCRTYP